MDGQYESEKVHETIILLIVKRLALIILEEFIKYQKRPKIRMFP